MTLASHHGRARLLSVTVLYLTNENKACVVLLGPTFHLQRKEAEDKSVTTPEVHRLSRPVSRFITAAVT